MNKLITIFLTCLLAATSQTATCKTVTIIFSGKITATAIPDAAVGNLVTGIITYDNKLQAFFSEKTAAHYSIQAPYSFTLAINGISVSSTKMQALVMNNWGGNLEDAIMIDGSAPSWSDQTLRDGTVSIVLGSGPGMTNALHSTKLPTKFKLEDFGAMNYGVVQRNGGQDGQLVQFSIDALSIASKED